MEAFPGRADIPVGTVPPSARGVAAVLNDREAGWFLNASALQAAESLGIRRLDTGARGGAASLPALVELNPEVLISGWSTPFLPEKWLESGECRLRYICHLAGSVRHVVSRRFIERGGLVTNWGGIPSKTVAEHALLLALAALRNLPRWPEIFAQPAATDLRMQALQTRTLVGRRVGIHGFGQAARALVELLAPFDVTVTAYSPGVPAELFAAAGVRQAGSLREIFAESDVVFECEALTVRTRESVGEPELAALRAGGVFVNVARAGIVVEAALLRAAASGRISVALDVFAEEPLPAASPWRTIPGAVLSPHIAGPTFDQYGECTRAALDNVHRYFAQQPLRSVVTTEIYDRST